MGDGDESDGGAKEDDPRLVSRMDARRLRFLPADLSHQGHRQGVRRRGAAGRLRAVPHLGHALRRRLHLRPDRRQMGPQAGADARHRLLFRDRRARRLRAEPVGVLGPARAVRRGDGRRMGPRQFAGDGVDSAAGARRRLRRPAMRLSRRLPARLDRLRPALRAHVRRLHRRLAGHVPAQHPACVPRAVHPHQRAPNRPPSPRRRRSAKRACGRRSPTTGDWRSTRSC